MGFTPESEEDLVRQVAFALEDESFHPLDEVQDDAPENCRYFSDLESSLSDWSFAYGVAWTSATGLKDILRRTVFVIQPDGKIVYRWDVPDPPRLPTADEVLGALA